MEPVPAGERLEPRPDAPRRGGRRRALLRRLWLYPLLYLGICGVMFLAQRTIQYPGDPSPVPLPANAAELGLSAVELLASDGVRLHGWYLPGRGPGTIVFFHGNGGHRGWRLEWMEMLRAQGPGVFILDYRGYGGSEGSPTEEGLYRDGEAAIEWARENAPGPLILMGESLGSAVAVEMARRHDPAGLILHAAFSSTVDVARSRLFFLPVGLLMRDRFESDLKIEEVRCPKIFFHGREDGVVPYRYGQKLFVAATEPKRWVDIPAAGHMDLHIRDVARYYGALRTFLEEILPVVE